MGEHASARAVVTLALGAGVIEAASMLPYLGAIGILTTADVSLATGSVVLTGYVLVMLAPAVLLPIAPVAFGRRLESPLTRARDWMVRHTKGALGWVIGTVGVLLALDAVRVLGERGVLGG